MFPRRCTPSCAILQRSKPGAAGTDSKEVIGYGTLKTPRQGNAAHVMSNNDVPIWEKYTLTIEEASKYFRIGENKLRRLAEENPTAGWVILNGNRIQIKRKQFEKIIDSLDTI